MLSLTRLRLRSWLYLPQFLWMNERAVKQIRHAPGLRGGRLLLDRNRVFWTMTLWGGEAQMRAYRDSDAHRLAMPKLQRWCDEATVARVAGCTELPNWQEAHRIMVTAGRASRVRHPSPDHAAMNFPQPRTTADRVLTPVVT